MTFSAIVKQTRQKKKLSIYRLAVMAGMTRKAVMEIEQGADVKMSNALKLCKALDITFTINDDE